MTLYDELKGLLASLRAHEIPYALCGGLALAVHGIPRSTIDIDLLVEKKMLEKVRNLAHRLGFTVDSGVMRMKKGAIQIH
ncbi:MAG: nucleotidyl transferase AbiEii/AbiGii toxin family protein [Chlamydiota bacterium]